MSKIVIGLTGGIGSGKSYVGQIFKLMGADLYEADLEAKKVMQVDLSLINNIKKEFGERAYSAEGEINRKFLSKLIFSDETKRAKLNSLVHPATLNHFKQFVDESKKEIVVIEAAILIESGFYREVDVIITVEADMDLRITRTMERDGVGRGEVESRIKAQISDSERKKYAHYIIKNNKNELLLTQIVSILGKVGSK